MMRNQCWASKPQVPISNRGKSSDKLIQKNQNSKLVTGGYSPQTSVTVDVSMWVYISLFNKHFFKKRRTRFNAAQFLKNRGENGEEHACFVFHNLPQDVCQRALVFACHWPRWYWLELLCFPLPWGNCLSKIPLWKQLSISSWENS